MSVSVVIPTYNRFENLLNCLVSILNQTYQNLEIIVVNDNSSDPRYYELNINKVRFIHLKKGSKEILGYPCGAYCRNIGMKNSNNEYIAFCDDDDIWMPNKLEIQLNEMKINDSYISCTEGYIGNGFYNNSIKYPLYNKEYYYEVLCKKYNMDFFKKEDFPTFIDFDFINKHNLIITSSVIMKNIVKEIGYMELIKNGGQLVKGEKIFQDYEYWKKFLRKYKCLYIKIPLFYYDLKKY